MSADKKDPQRDLGTPASEEAAPDGSVENPTPRTGGGGIDPAALGGPATAGPTRGTDDRNVAVDGARDKE